MEVENVFIDVTGKDETPYLEQHQRLFPGNVIARFYLNGRTVLKVPYEADDPAKPVGLSREQFEVLSTAPSGNMAI